MSSGKPGRATPVAILSCLLHRWMAIAVLLATVACLVFPAHVLAYRENMYELVVGSDPALIVQNQSYSTITRQDLFHTATNAVTDTESFAFDDNPQTGINLAQTTATTAAGTETGFFFSAASSDIVPPVHIGGGFLGTWIGDPLLTGAPIFAGMTFPEMTETDTSALAAMPAGLQPAGNATPAKSNQSASKTDKDIATFLPVIDYDLNQTLANESAGNAKAAANATKNATIKPAATPSPAIKAGDPFYHQQNKPFSTVLTSPSGPFKLTAEKTRNTTGFDRFLRNTVGRSTTDKAFNGTTSSPAYITPGKALAEQIPYDFIQGARGMTMPGTHLNYRAWPL
jgi:hypothetical protein